jgi:hypothetical protein
VRLPLTANPRTTSFILINAIFFAASTVPGARGNVSPRGTDAFAILDGHTVCSLDLTGGGVETAAHLKAHGRLTVMFCAFEGPPNIPRLYGRGESLSVEAAAISRCSPTRSAASSPRVPARSRGFT